MTTTENPLVRAYLRRLDDALANVPLDERRQIVDGVEEHAAAALAEFATPTESDVRDVLARLGDPEVITADAQERLGSPSSRGARLTINLLWIGAVVGVFDLGMVSTSQVGPASTPNRRHAHGSPSAFRAAHSASRSAKT